MDGDTLWDIAVRYGLTIDEMVAANPGIDPDRLKLGQMISIPAWHCLVEKCGPLFKKFLVKVSIMKFKLKMLLPRSI